MKTNGGGALDSQILCFSHSVSYRRRSAMGAARGKDGRSADERRSHTKPRVPASEWYESLL